VEEAGRRLVADGSDFVPVRAYVQDAHGTMVPLGDDQVKFSVTGEGAAIGGETIWANPMKAQAGVATALVRSTLKAGSITVTVEARGLKPATVTFQSQPLPTPIVPGAK
jgi:beta-galactosidase